MSDEISVSELHRRYLANVDWADLPDMAKANVFRSTVMAILAIRPQSLRKGASSQLDFDPIQLQKQLDEVNKFISRSNSDPLEEKRYFDFRGFRN